MFFLKRVFCSLLIYLITVSSVLNATPFSACPSKAFLMQKEVAQLYGLNLVTGSYELLSGDLGTTSKINAVGFNFHDNYIYGWGYEWSTVVRIGDDYQAQDLSLVNLPAELSGVNFYVGDVSISENSYYFYRKGSSYGLYKVVLDSDSSDYLEVTKVANSSVINLNIFDFAFHPNTNNNNHIYTVDRLGQLHKINPTNGNTTALGNVGQQGTFGAVYFDKQGKLYISRNNDGLIYIIDPEAANPSATLFANGPISGNNDGARCAIAPIIDESLPATTDYGDAPDTYGTSLANNGARHGIGDIYLGNSITAEHNAKVYPNTDEDDGVVFVTPLIAGTDSLVQVQANGSGYLSIWADWDRDGQFSATEKLVSDKFIDNTTINMLVNTPINALNGFTWTRTRFTSTQSVTASGGIADGEVEDYNVFVTNLGYSQIQDTPYYLAFEDNWPEKGDYDMNDVVIFQESSLLVNGSGEIKQIEFHGELKAYGASYQNGFAIQLDGILPSNVNSSLVRFEINGVVQETSAIEIGTDNVVVFITDDIGSHIQLSNNCLYYRTEANCTNSNEMKFSVTIPFINAIDENTFPVAPYNPFIFAKEATYHGNLITQPGRELEIHLKNKLPTSKASETFFGQGIDATNVSANETYQSNSGLPWALAISPGSGEEWKHPLETIEILQAYPKFQIFSESNGASEATWFSLSNAENSKLY